MSGASSESLRVCLLTTFYPPFHFGGDAIVVRRLAGALAAAGHRVDVVHSIDAYRAGGGRTPRAGYPELDGVRRIPLEGGFGAALAAQQVGGPALYRRRLREVLETDPYDVVHFHNVSLIGGPGILRLGTATKLYTAHEYWLVCATHVLFRYGREPCRRRTCFRCTLRAGRPPQLWRATGRLERCLGEVDRLLVPTRFAAERHRRLGDAVEIEVLAPPVPVPAPGAESEEADSQGADSQGVRSSQRPYFLFVGRLEPLKGVVGLLPLFDSSSDAELLIVGEGSDRARLERESAGRAVRFLGPRSDAELGPLYRDAVAVLAPSRCYETFGLTVAEGMAWGTPAVVAGHGALAELVGDSGGGLVADSPMEWASAVERLAQDPDLRAELAACGARHARREWSVEAHLERYLELVAELRGLGRRRRRRADA